MVIACILLIMIMSERLQNKSLFLIGEAFQPRDDLGKGRLLGANTKLKKDILLTGNSKDGYSGSLRGGGNTEKGKPQESYKHSNNCRRLKIQHHPLRHLHIENAAYFISTNTYKREKLFLNRKYAQIVIDAIIYGKNNSWYELLAFVVMPDHLHLCLIPCNRSVPSIMQGIKGYVSRKINIMRNMKRKLWQKEYRDFVMDEMEPIYQKLRYIEENPVRAGLVENSVDYPFSSVGKYDEYDLSSLY